MWSPVEGVRSRKSPTGSGRHFHSSIFPSWFQISGQNPKCRMTEVSHNGALYYYSAVNSSWFLQFNYKGHRMKNSDNHTVLQRNISELSLPPTNTSNCSDCSSVSTSSLSSSSSLSPSSSSSSPSSTSLTIPPSPSPSSATSHNSSVASSDHRRHARRYPKYSKCQGFIKIPLASSTSPPSLNFKSVKWWRHERHVMRQFLLFPLLVLFIYFNHVVVSRRLGWWRRRRWWWWWWRRWWWMTYEMMWTFLLSVWL